MKQLSITCFLLLALMVACSAQSLRSTTFYQYFRTGAAQDAATHPRFGIAMMGGGSDLDPAFVWLCDHADHGDLLVLRATGDDDYNPYIAKLCQLNSISTLVLPDKAAANDPFVREQIAHAEAIFISGGDQANYMRFWKGTPVETAINESIRAGVPIGGTSAGLAVLTDYVFSALNDSAYSEKVLFDPFDPTVTLDRGFVHIPMLRGTISDQHFVKRDRLGRFLVFMARLLADGTARSIHGLAVDEGNAFLVEADGSGKLVGPGAAYFFTPRHQPEVCRRGAPLTFTDIAVHRIRVGDTFDLKAWRGTGGADYTLAVTAGKIQSSASSPY